MKTQIIEKQIKEQMENAFWDIIKEDLQTEPQKFSHLLKLINEIKQKIINLTPNRIDFRNEINEMFDEEFLLQIFETKSLDSNHFGNLVIFIIKKIEMCCAPYMDNEVKEWKDTINIKLQNDLKYHEFIPFYFKKVYYFLEKIENDIQKFKSEQQV